MMPAEADLLIDPTGGTVIFDDSSNFDDAVSISRPLNFTFNFFDIPISAVDVSTNGHLNFIGDADFFNVPMPDPFMIARISPLWDDLIINAGNGAFIIEKGEPGVFYSVTWVNMEVLYAESGNSSGTARQTFQAVLIGAPTTIRGYSFVPGDIVFSYEFVDAAFADDLGAIGATVGLDKGDGLTFIPLPGDDDGLITNAQKNLLPTGVGAWIVFRPNGMGSYNAFVTPEPSLAILLMVGLGLTVTWRYKRKNE